MIFLAKRSRCSRSALNINVTRKQTMFRPKLFTALLVPLVVGVVLGTRHVRWPIAIAIAVAGVQSLIWVWALTTPGDCGATAFLWTSLTA